MLLNTKHKACLMDKMMCAARDHFSAPVSVGAVDSSNMRLAPETSSFFSKPASPGRPGYATCGREHRNYLT